MKSLITLSFLALLGCAAKQDKQPNDYFEKMDFQFESLSEKITIELVEFHPNVSLCHTEGGIPYTLLIGETNKSELPKTISVLSKCDKTSYRIGERYEVTPIEDPTNNTSLNYIRLMKDTIINGRRRAWLIGSEFPAIWGKPNQIK